MAKVNPLTNEQQELVNRLAMHLCKLIMEETETLVRCVSIVSAKSAEHTTALADLLSQTIAAEVITKCDEPKDKK